MNRALTSAEQDLIKHLPRPPDVSDIRASNVWIVEWLPATDTKTGRILHEWMNERRDGWSAYFSCQSEKDVLEAIAMATATAQRSALSPVLHVEAHGGNVGLEGPNGGGGTELLTWDELTGPLQDLNLATRCNLLMVVAACTGFAGIQALQRGPRAPAVALVGPDAPVMPTKLLWGTKEFYRRWLDEKPRLAEIAESASREAGTVSFEWEPFAAIAYDAFVQNLLLAIRPAERIRRTEMIRQRLLRETQLQESEIEARLAAMPPIPSCEALQQTWDEMFMIDIEPANRERFGLDVRGVVTRILAHGAQ